MVRVLFVCLGNICRSATAEAIFKYKVKAAGLSAIVTCDSAGTAGYHAGEVADSRMRLHAIRRGYKLDSVARQVDPTVDFGTFDMIIGMDDSNVSELKSMAPHQEGLDKISKITDYCPCSDVDCVPDPYYGGDDGFEFAIDVLEKACEGLLSKIKGELL